MLHKGRSKYLLLCGSAAKPVDGLRSGCQPLRDHFMEPRNVSFVSVALEYGSVGKKKIKNQKIKNKLEAALKLMSLPFHCSMTGPFRFSLSAIPVWLPPITEVITFEPPTNPSARCLHVRCTIQRTTARMTPLLIYRI